MSRHPAEGDLRASLDGELSLWRRAQIRLHLRSCPHCSDRQSRILLASARTSKLLATVAASTDLAESWQRLSARAEGRRGSWVRGMTSLPARGLAVAGALAAGLFLLSAPWSSGSGAERIIAGQVVQDTCCGDHDGDGMENEGVLHFVTDKGQQAVSVTYSDRDRSRSFSSGDVVHSVYRAPRPR
jgi:hypothetical protein